MQMISVLDQIDILNNIQHGIIVIDTEGTILYLNSASEEIFNYSLEEISGKSLKILYDDDDYLAFEHLLDKCKDKKKYRGRWRAKSKNGNHIWLDVRSISVYDEDQDNQYCVISINSIETLETVKRHLKRVTALEKTILEASADAIITADEKGQIVSFNRAAEQMFGYQKGEIAGKDVQILIPSFYAKHKDFFLGRYNSGIEISMNGGDFDLQGLRKDGTVFYISMSVSNIPWKGERLFVGIIRDLTQKRELEKRMIDITNEERRRIGRELHDGLGQMLTGIRMVAENLARKLKANEIPGAGEVQEIADMVREADEHARTLSHGLIEINLEKIGLSAALENLAERIPKTYNIDCTYAENGRIEFINHTMVLHIYRIVQEAVTNAVRHADAENIHIRLSKNEKHTAVIIEDDGTGFDPQKIIDNGSGIQIMKYRADIMGGILDIYRTEDGKTQVRCIIPNNLEYFDDTNKSKSR